MTLRLAKPEDFPEILRMARAFHEASPFRLLNFSETQCEGMFRTYLSDPKTVIVILSDHGMIIGYASPAPFSSDRISTEVAWWVDPEGRGKRESLLLFEAYEDWSRRVGCKLCQVAMLPDLTNLNKFYEKRGYRLMESSYVKEL